MLLRSGLRELARRKTQAFLAFAGIALGAAVVVAIDTSSNSVRRGFELSNDVVNGRSTHYVLGGTEGLDESFYAGLRTDGVPVVPLVTGNVRIKDSELSGMKVLGIDPIMDLAIRPKLAPTVDIGDITRTDSFAVVMTRRAAERRQLEPGTRFTVVADARETELVVAQLIEPDESLYDEALVDTLIVDIALAQHILSQRGRLSRLDIAGDEVMLGKIRKSLPEGAQIRNAQSATQIQRDMVTSLETNLAALSLLALLIGVFLIYNTMTFSVVRRRQSIGMLRAIGVTRSEIASSLLIEALILGVVACAFGVGIGLLLAKGLIVMMTQTVNDLYFKTEVASLSIEPLALLGSFLLGVAATLFATLVPALEATRTPPRAVMSRADLERRASTWSRWALWSGGACIVVAVVILLLPTTELVVAFAGLFFLIIGFALMLPMLLPLVVKLLMPLLRGIGGLEALMGARYVTRSTSRTGVAVAALAVAVSATIGVTLMISSFRLSLIDWLETRLRADIYVSTATDSGATSGLSLDYRQALGAVDGVAAIGFGHWTTVDAQTRRYSVLILDTTATGLSGYVPDVDDIDEVWQRFSNENVVFVSESIANRTGVGAGDTLGLPTDRGDRRFDIEAVYKDYRSDQGVILMSRPTWLRYFDDATISAAALTLKEGVSMEVVLDRVRALSMAPDGLDVRSNRDLKAASIKVFDRTFAVTDVLRLLAVLVAAIGIVSALMALQFERGRDIAVLRAIGYTPGQIARIATTETFCMGFASGLFAIPLGVLTAWILVEVVNRRAFGWTMDFHVTPTVLLQGLALAVVAALIAGIIPTVKAVRQPPALGLRNE